MPAGRLLGFMRRGLDASGSDKNRPPQDPAFLIRCTERKPFAGVFANPISAPGFFPIMPLELKAE